MINKDMRRAGKLVIITPHYYYSHINCLNHFLKNFLGTFRSLGCLTTILLQLIYNNL